MTIIKPFTALVSVFFGQSNAFSRNYLSTLEKVKFFHFDFNSLRLVLFGCCPDRC
jgi:hypothetical protein